MYEFITIASLFSKAGIMWINFNEVSCHANVSIPGMGGKSTSVASANP